MSRRGFPRPCPPPSPGPPQIPAAPVPAGPCCPRRRNRGGPDGAAPALPAPARRGCPRPSPGPRARTRYGGRGGTAPPSLPSPPVAPCPPWVWDGDARAGVPGRGGEGSGPVGLSITARPRCVALGTPRNPAGQEWSGLDSRGERATLWGIWGRFGIPRGGEGAGCCLTPLDPRGSPWDTLGSRAEPGEAAGRPWARRDAAGDRGTARGSRWQAAPGGPCGVGGGRREPEGVPGRCPTIPVPGSPGRSLAPGTAPRHSQFQSFCPLRCAVLHTIRRAA